MATAEKIRLEGRNGAVWRAYCGGETQDQIAEAHGITQGRVSQILTEVRQSIPEQDKAAERLRSLETLHRARSALLPRVVDGDTAAIGALVNVDKRIAGLLGLDDPTRVDLNATVEANAEAIRAEMDRLLLPVLHAVLSASGCPYGQRAEYAEYGQAVFLYELGGREGDLPTPPTLEAPEAVSGELLPSPAAVRRSAGPAWKTAASKAEALELLDAEVLDEFEETWGPIDE